MAKINLDSIRNKITIAGKNAIDNTIPILKQGIEDQTPEDTRKLIGSYKTTQAKKNGGKLQGDITTNTEYAKYVEYGVGKVFRYQKPKGNKGRYVGIGARMFARGFDTKRNDLIKSMKKNFILRKK